MSFAADSIGRAFPGVHRLTDPVQQAKGDVSPKAALVQKIHATSSPVEQGALLHRLDKLTGGRAQSEALLQREAPGQVRPVSGGAGKPAPAYDASDLYLTGGKPLLSDIQQSNFGDCYYVATLGAVAAKSPSTITDAIRYDPKTQSFNVTMHDDRGRERTINVTQSEIASNIAMGGGSRRDGGDSNAAIWPDVMEVAYAKLLDTNHADGLSEGYTDLGDGGWPKDGMEAITGREGTELKFDKSWYESRNHALDELGQKAADALRDGKPVTAWSVAESDNRGLIDRIRGKPIERDGLANDHVYTVTKVYKDKNGDWQVQLRNPWSHNLVGEGHDTTSAYITVSLDKLTRTQGLESFRVGQ